MRVKVTSSVIEAAERAAEQAAEQAGAEVMPEEACGILFGDGDRITSLCKTRNVHPSPQTHFEIDPQALIDAHRSARAGGPKVMGYFHSHPNGDPAPSQTDQAMSARDGSIWVIAARGELGWWRDGQSGFEPLSCCIVPI